MNASDVLNARTIAIVGLSENPDRPSYEVASYFQSKGYTIIPVNPNVESVLGEKAYPDISSIPENVMIDIVDIFRRSEFVLEPVQQAVQRSSVQMIWLQEGIENEKAKKIAEEHNILFIENVCLMKTDKQHHE